MFSFLFSQQQKRRQQLYVTTNKIIANNVFLFTNARDERNLKEWATHHLLLGFTRVIIFDHKSKESLKKKFENFDKRVIIIDGSKVDGQVKFYFMNWALRISRVLKADWFLYLDADEFLVLRPPLTQVKDFLETYPFQNASAISLNWLMFGSNFLEKDSNDLIVESYTRSDKVFNPHVKTFVKTIVAKHATNPHFYNLDLNFCQYSFDGKMNHPFCQNNTTKEVSDVSAYIAHYINQSEETYQRRKVLLPADDTGIKRPAIDIKKIHNSHNDIENYEVMDLFAKKIKDFLS